MKICIFFPLVMLLFFASGSTSLAQSGKKKQKTKRNAPAQQPTALDPYYPRKEYGPKKSRGKSENFVVYDSEKRYYDQRAAVAKEKRKAEKQMMKPQYSDPMYFGHRKPPKKHKPGKMKYCKECGLRH